MYVQYREEDLHLAQYTKRSAVISLFFFKGTPTATLIKHPKKPFCASQNVVQAYQNVVQAYPFGIPHGYVEL